MWKERQFMFSSVEIESIVIADRRLRNVGLFCFKIRYSVQRCFDLHSAVLTIKL
jgi:hypothetical protein